MKTIHLKCGHRISVRVWPSKTGLAKVRHHYKKFHPGRMRKMTKKSLATKRRRGLVNPGLNPGLSEYEETQWLSAIKLYGPSIMEKSLLSQEQKSILISKALKIKKILATKRRRGLIKNRCNPKRSLPRRHAPLRLLKQYERDYLEKTLGKSWGLMPKSTIMRVLKKLKSLKSNPQPIVIYDKLLGIEARKGHGKFSGENFRHDFKHKTDAVVLGNPDGSLTIRSKKGKRLWKKFEY